MRGNCRRCELCHYTLPRSSEGGGGAVIKSHLYSPADVSSPINLAICFAARTMRVRTVRLDNG